MKHANKFNTAKISSNQRIGSWLEEAYKRFKQTIKQETLF